MIYSTCRLRPLEPIKIDRNREKKYLLKGRYRQAEINYKLYKEKVSLTSVVTSINGSFSLQELKESYPHLDFSLPLVVEFCSGTGEFLIDLAQRYPEFLFIGVEVALPCVQRALTKIGSSHPHNLLFYHGEGKDFLSHDFCNFKFSSMMINFPDPWPKKRHIKRRIISTEFVTLSRDRLANGGSFHTATDVEPLHLYHSEIIDPILTPLNSQSSLNSQRNNDPDFPKILTIKQSENFYLSSSRYQEKNLSRSKKVFYTHHYKSLS